MYDPGTANAWKLLVRNAAMRPWDRMGRHVFDGPVSVGLYVFMPRPKTHSNSKGALKPSAPRWHTNKPDIDNLEKSVFDALTNMGVWTDDSQVCQVSKAKVYGARPGALIIISDSVQDCAWTAKHADGNEP